LQLNFTSQNMTTIPRCLALASWHQWNQNTESKIVERNIALIFPSLDIPALIILFLFFRNLKEKLKCDSGMIVVGRTDDLSSFMVVDTVVALTWGQFRSSDPSLQSFSPLQRLVFGIHWRKIVGGGWVVGWVPSRQTNCVPSNLVHFFLASRGRTSWSSPMHRKSFSSNFSQLCWFSSLHSKPFASNLWHFGLSRGDHLTAVRRRLLVVILVSPRQQIIIVAFIKFYPATLMWTIIYHA